MIDSERRWVLLRNHDPAAPLDGIPARRVTGAPSVTFLLALLAALGWASPAWAQASFSKAFTPDTIGPGSTSTLVFSIDNPTGSTVTGLAFTDTLPAAVTIADPASATTDCGGTLTAPAGGGTITFSGGSLGAFASCTVSVNVTSATPGVHTNVSGDLTSSAGNSGTATDDLTVATDRPGFSKSFSPDPISRGERSTLTFTIDNSASPDAASNLTFTDSLPSGMEVAGPSNASTTCTGGTITATSGGQTVSYGPAFFGDASVAASATCTVSVDVVGTGNGSLDNTSGELTSFVSPQTRTSGLATASLTVNVDTLALSKAFTDDPVPGGGTVTLEFTIQNFDRSSSATGLTFTDDVDATLPGLTATSSAQSDVCGPGSTFSGGGLLTLVGGNLGPGASCTFSVTLQVPAGAAAGAYPNTTSSLSGALGGSAETGSPASDTLFVAFAPALTKTFLDPVVGAGDDATIEFTITNTSATSGATDIAFIDNITELLSSPPSVTLPAPGFCGAGSTMNLVNLGVEGQGISMTGGSLGPSGSCTFTVTTTLPVGLFGGTHTNTTEEITATVDGETVTGSPASDSFVVAEAPSLTKEFTDDPAVAGGTVTLEFTLTHDELAPSSATNITFTDDLSAALSGLAAVGLPATGVCGAGSQLDGTTSLSLTGGSLAPGGSCTFSATLQVPVAATPGTYTNSTSNVTASVSGVTATNSGAQDDLLVGGVSITKTFTDDPVIPGDTVTLEFTLANTSASTDVTDLTFTDDLDADLSGLAATGLPLVDPCGAGSSLSGSGGNTFLSFTGGNLTAGASCTFSVTLQVPAGAASETYGNTTSQLTGTFGGETIAVPGATDQLTVSGDLLVLQKSFVDDPVGPGATATLEFTVSNQATDAATGITFTDDLDAALSGLTAVGLPADGFCGAGSQISGAGLLTVTGGNLPAGASCTFSVTVQVPAATSAGAYTNTTSQVTGTAGGLGVSGAAASDDLDVASVEFTKSFDGPTAAGGSPVLTFTLRNLSSTDTAGSLGFVDDLDAVLPGLAAVGLPANDVCGAGSMVTGTTSLTFSGGSLAPGASCTFDVTLQVPAGASPGTFPNTTSDLSSAGLMVAAPATDSLVIEPPPAFGKAFAPAAMNVGETSTLTFTIDNTASGLAATGLDFTDGLPAGVQVASPPNASTTCAGGTLTAAAGSGTVSYTGGTVGAGASCTVQVDVTSVVPGSHVNTSGDLTSSLGNSGAATDTLDVLSLTCAPGLTPPSATIPAAGGSGGFTVDMADAACSWTATASDPAVTITGGASGMGDGSVSYDVTATPGPARSFSIEVAVGATGESATHAIDQTVGTCAPAAIPPSATIPAAGGSSSFDVDVADATCSWTATASDPAVTITGGASGTGDGTVGYDVTATPGPARSFSIEVAMDASSESTTHAIDQGAATCSFTLTPTSASYPEEGGSGSVAVDANQPDCDWTAVSDSEWLTVSSGASGSGDGTVDYDVAPSNWAVPRTGVLTIAGQAFTVEQEAGTCTFSISPSALAFGVFAGTQTITVDTGVACTWDATSNDEWIGIQSIDDGDGPGTVTVGIDRNETGEDRDGTATIAGQTLTVSQSGDGEPSFVLSPQAAGFPGAGGAGQVGVQAPSEADWQAVSSAPWLTIAGGSEGLGNGNIFYTVAPNPGQTAREATIDVSGQTFTVKQAPAGESTLQIWITDVLSRGAALRTRLGGSR